MPWVTTEELGDGDWNDVERLAQYLSETLGPVLLLKTDVHEHIVPRDLLVAMVERRVPVEELCKHPDIIRRILRDWLAHIADKNN